MSSEAPNARDAPTDAAVQRSPWSRPEVWTLGAFAGVGLAGFIATFLLIIVRSPSSPHAPMQGAFSAPQLQSTVGSLGERGPAGPAGPRGAPGDSGIRILRSDCATGNCTVECADDEMLLNAYCSPNHTLAVYPTEHSALCRPAARGKVEVVAACVKSRRQ